MEIINKFGNPALYGFTLLQAFTLLSVPMDSEFTAVIEKLGIIGVLAYLNYQQRNDMKELQTAARTEETNIRKEFLQKENEITNRYEKLLTELAAENRQSLAKKDEVIKDLHTLIMEKARQT
jgi:predicted NAD/FAD-binding protein